jgi:hypothetical protein
MNINEKTLSRWLEANGQGKPSKESLQFARSLACEPEFLGSNNWQTPSTSKPDTSYKQQVYFAGFDANTSHGLNLRVECDCPATKECIHVQKLQRVYCANWTYLFILFGLDTKEIRMSALWAKAKAVYAQMEVEAANDTCGCRWNMDDKFIEFYCERHYWEMKAEEAQAEAWDGYERQRAA